MSMEERSHNLLECHGGRTEESNCGGRGGGGEEVGWPTTSATCFLVPLTCPLAGKVPPLVVRAASTKCTHDCLSPLCLTSVAE